VDTDIDSLDFDTLAEARENARTRVLET